MLVFDSGIVNADMPVHTGVVALKKSFATNPGMPIVARDREIIAYAA
jgi:hypothetical protein